MIDRSKEKIRHKSKFPLNTALTVLTFVDVFSWGGYIALNTIVGLFLAEKLDANVIEIVGVGNGIYLITRALTQIPIGIFTDKIKRDRDEIALLILGSFLMGGVFVAYSLLDKFEIYWGLQFVLGLGVSLNLVTWRKLFAKNLDDDHEGSQYATYDTINSLSSATFSIIAGVVGGLSMAYFSAVIVIFGVVIMFGGLVAAMLYLVKSRKTA